ncbi:MAG: MAPEG family protein [Deltaproteobacteria bacterium]|nr:MAPEG family protein [Deltaproteobacteria bacterium]NNK08120.1 MAPEG family protein [Myxococcales bacterium]
MSALEWLAASALMTALFWIPYILERMVALGILGALKPVDPEDELRQALWARRAKRGHYNAVENLVIFATLVLVAFSMGKGEEPSILAATQVYFWARLVHFPAITFGFPGIRTVAFLAGFGAQIAVALRIFT